jgi:hypothetical protein
MPVTIREVRQELRVQIGESIEAYASVEAKQAFLLATSRTQIYTRFLTANGITNRRSDLQR